MSARAPEPAERSDWRGEGVAVSEVAAELRRLTAEHMHHEHGHASTWTLNLIVTPARRDRVQAGLDSLHERIPARMVVLHEHEAERIDAAVTVHCQTGDQGRRGYCHEEIDLVCDRAHLDRAGGVVHPLLVADLPTVVWVAGSDTRAAEAVAPLAERILVDSAAGADAMAALRRAAALRRHGHVDDAAWHRLDRWRKRLAGACDPAPGREVALAADRLEVRHGAEAGVLGLLLAGWAAARLGWRDLRLPPGPEARRGTAVRADGAPVAIDLVPFDGPPATRVIGVTLGAGEREIRLERPLGPRPPETLADTLAGMADPAPGYDDALRALGA
ncbi:MAG: glucose-6-phosphate dehydrogenase assembly protein OpcA [Thermoleophilia bacterium]|nr:glucose-6-phosphate dehydrogenase assembly protein OpcA [Thermoleophilia bacterium]